MLGSIRWNFISFFSSVLLQGVFSVTDIWPYCEMSSRCIKCTTWNVSLSVCSRMMTWRKEKLKTPATEKWGHVPPADSSWKDTVHGAWTVDLFTLVWMTKETTPWSPSLSPSPQMALLPLALTHWCQPTLGEDQSLMKSYLRPLQTLQQKVPGREDSGMLKRY